tara:strand:+ start:522 stop:1025 length:504 start_codon:yes stop_codon:yes gene_type:complete
MAVHSNNFFPAGGEAGNAGGIVQCKVDSSNTIVTGTGGYATVTNPASTSISLQGGSNKVIIFAFMCTGQNTGNETVSRLFRNGVQIAGSSGGTVAGASASFSNGNNWAAATNLVMCIDEPGSGTHSYQHDVICGTPSNHTIKGNYSNGSGSDDWRTRAQMILLEVSS